MKMCPSLTFEEAGFLAMEIDSDQDGFISHS